MKKVEAFKANTYEGSNSEAPPTASNLGQNTYTPPFAGFQENLSGLVQNTVGELAQDAQNVGTALYGFPIGSTLKLIGLATILYIVFKVGGKFVNIKEKLSRL